AFLIEIALVSERNQAKIPGAPRGARGRSGNGWRVGGLAPGELLGEGGFLPLVLLALQGEIDPGDLARIVLAAIGRARMIVGDRLPVVADLVDLLAQDPGGDADVVAGVVEMLL